MRVFGTAARAPQVYCPFPSRVSPHADDVQRHARAWAERHGLLTSTRARAAFDRARFAELPARAHPGAQRAPLTLATDWLTAVFALDDHLETGLVRQRRSALAAVDALVRWLRGKAPVPDGLGPGGGALADVWRRTLSTVDEDWTARFVDHFEEYLAGTLWESRNRARGRLPGVEEYLAMRRHSAATEMFFDLIEPVHGITAGAALLGDPHHHTQRRAAGTAIGLCNDLVSWPKEVAAGDPHNVVFVVGRERGLPMPEAIHAAVALHDAQVELVVRAYDALGAPRDPAVADLLHWLRGNLDWSLSTGRYAAGDAVVPSQRR